MLIGDLKPLQQLAKPDAEVEEAELEVEETDGLDEKFDDSDVDENKEVDEDLYDGLHEGAADTENDPAQTPASTTSAAAADEQTEGGAVVAAAGEPVGDAALLADLGIVAAELIALCAQDHMLPSDVIAEICGRIGCGAEYEELRDSATL
jgi:putative tRNA adenosine deaminase-associated protein